METELRARGTRARRVRYVLRGAVALLLAVILALGAGAPALAQSEGGAGNPAASGDLPPAEASGAADPSSGSEGTEPTPPPADGGNSPADSGVTSGEVPEPEPENSGGATSGEAPAPQTYTVKWSVDEEIIGTDTVAAGEMPTPPDVPDFDDAEAHHTFTGWQPAIAPASADITYTAVFESGPLPPQIFTVTWVVRGVSTTESYPAGEMPTFKGALDGYSEGGVEYSFQAWDHPIAAVASDVTYTALFAANYTVTWVIEGSTSTERYPEGEMPAYKGTPAKAPTAEREYRFKGWSPELTPVAGNATYTALFEEVARAYTVTWVVGEETISENYSYNETPSYKGDPPTKEGGVGQSFTFTGWEPAIAPVTANVTYTAVFSGGARTYTVTWVVGEETTTSQVAFGETPVFSGSTERAPEEEVAYRFTGWDKELTPVTGDVTYTAQYEEEPRSFTVTWVVEGKRTEETYAYGVTPSFKGTPEKTSDEEFRYAFSGWDKKLSPVKEDATYIARFDRTPLTDRGAKKSSILGSPIFWVILVIVLLLCLAVIGLLVLQKIKREDPTRFPWADKLLAALPLAKKEQAPEPAPPSSGAASDRVPPARGNTTSEHPPVRGNTTSERIPPVRGNSSTSERPPVRNGATGEWPTGRNSTSERPPVRNSNTTSDRPPVRNNTTSERPPVRNRNTTSERPPVRGNTTSERPPVRGNGNTTSERPPVRGSARGERGEDSREKKGPSIWENDD